MRNAHLLAYPKAAVLAAITLALAAALSASAPASAKARSMQLHGAYPINVNVSFNTQVPLPDLREETITASHKAGRKFIYRMGRDECAVLVATIAKTCRLTNLNISTRVQNNNNRGPVKLQINGNATFSISLKDDGR